MEHDVKKILIVEDDLALKPIWEKFFKLLNGGTGLDWAVSCEEAVKMVRAANESTQWYDLIISDIFLAGSRTGIQFLNSPEVMTSKARTVLISAVEREDIINKYGHQLTGTVVISKPFNFRTYEPLFKKILFDVGGGGEMDVRAGL